VPRDADKRRALSELEITIDPVGSLKRHNCQKGRMVGYTEATVSISHASAIKC
jgi:hypothetical protein